MYTIYGITRKCRKHETKMIMSNKSNEKNYLNTEKNVEEMTINVINEFTKILNKKED